MLSTHMYGMASSVSPLEIRRVFSSWRGSGWEIGESHGSPNLMQLFKAAIFLARWMEADTRRCGQLKNWTSQIWRGRNFIWKPGKRERTVRKKDPKLATSCLLKLLMQFVSSGNKPKKKMPRREKRVRVGMKSAF